MKMSRRAKRMDSHHKRNRSKAAIHLVSLMDIFTILVFFLLVNSSEVQVLPNAKALKLPESIAEKKPQETLVVMVNSKEILLQGHSVVKLDAMTKSDEELIPALQSALTKVAGEARAKTDEPDQFRGAITIMADKQIPYHLLKRVMVTCAETDYGNISLAVMQRPEAKQGGTLL